MMNKQHPLYQEDLQYILKTQDIETIQNKSFLITGSTGLIGTCLIDALMLYNQLGANIKIFAVGRSKSKAFERFRMYYNNPYFHFIEQDVRVPLPNELMVDYILPLASNTHPLAYSEYPIETIEINVKGVEHALKKASECGAVVIYPSSVEIYGNTRNNEDVFSEDYTGNLNLLNARSCYPESKRLSESLCQSYLIEKNVCVKIARLSRVFGPTMLENDTKASSQFLLKALRHEDIVLKSNGEQFFSYTYVSDAVSALLHILIHGIKGQVYNISSDLSNIHLKDFANLCAKWANKRVIYELPSEKENKGYSIAMKAIMSNDRLSQIGWYSTITVENAIKRTLDILSCP